RETVISSSAANAVWLSPIRQTMHSIKATIPRNSLFFISCFLLSSKSVGCHGCQDNGSGIGKFRGTGGEHQNMGVLLLQQGIQDILPQRQGIFLDIRFKTVKIIAMPVCWLKNLLVG